MEYLINFDYHITAFIHSIIPHNIFFDYFFSFLSLRGNSILFWIVLIVIAILLEERKHPGIQKKDIQFITTFLLSFLFTSLLVNVVLKNIFQRPRPLPTTTYNLITTTCPSDYSFPSGHASSAFAAATVLAAFDKKRRWVYFTFAFLISFSRIYLGCHYFFDVLAGALIGWSISFVILKLKGYWVRQ